MGIGVPPVPGERAGVRQHGAHLARIGGGDGGEALAVVGGAADAVQAELRVVDGEHDFGPPQPVVVVLIPGGASLASGLCCSRAADCHTGSPKRSMPHGRIQT